MTNRPTTPSDLGIEDLDLAKIEKALTPRLDSFTASENHYPHEGKWKEPKFTVVALIRHSLAIDTVLAIEIECEKGLAFIGYEIVGADTRFRRGISTEILYHGIASVLWADQLAGDYPIGKADFTNPEAITWPTHTDDEVYLHTVDELLDYVQTRLGSDEVWVNDEFFAGLMPHRGFGDEEAVKYSKGPE
ncbi:hypothetical protein ACKFR8_03850 [Corynebacterium axilliensis]|uniref:hypothetical protein n=1 Tax=Corynebacterium sp. YSMAA5_1_F9 TaxID=3383591 RepID=UPI0038D1913F